jgi:acyl-CoA thioesterase
VFRSRTTAEGFFEEDGELWSQDGTLLAQSRQLGPVIE